MINVQIGIGHNNNIEAAIKEAVINFKNPKFIFICSEFKKFKQSVEILKDMYPNSIIIGTTGFSLVQGQVIKDNIVLWAVDSGMEFNCGVIENISKYPLKAIKEIEEKIKDIDSGLNDTVCLEVCTGNEEVLVSTLNSALEKKNIPLIGATTHGSDDSGKKYVYLNGKLYNDACVYVLMKNMNGKVKVYKESIYKNKKEKLIATKVDIKNRKIIELNGIKAENLYCEKLGIKSNELSKYNLINPLGRIVGKDTFITAINPESDDKSLRCYKRVNKNDVISILELGDYEKIVKDTINNIKSDFNNISFIFSINCICRFLLFEHINYLDKYSKDFNFSGNHFGIISEGEQYMNQHINQTMICVVFE